VLYYGQRRYDEADLSLQRALAIKQKALGPEHPEVAGSLKNLAELYKTQGRDAEAYATGRRAFAILRERALAGAAQDGAGGDAERQSNRSAFLFFLAVAAAQAGTVPEQRDAIASESFVAAQLAGQSSADRALAQASLRFASASDALALIVRERQDAMDRRRMLDKAIVAAASQPPNRREPDRELAIRNELAALDGKLGAVDARLRRDFPEFAALSVPRPLALDAAQKLLAADEALIVLVVANDAVYRFILRSDRAEFRRIEVKRVVLEEQVLALRTSLDLGGVTTLAELHAYDAAIAHELYRSLFVGAEALLAGARRLLIVPDGPLGGLPFSVLATRPPPAGTGRFDAYRRVDWLARDYAIAVLPSAGSLQALRVFAARARSPREPFLGFGDPDLAGRPGDVKGKGKAMARLASRSAIADVRSVRELDALPDTADELRRIARSLGADPTASTHLREAASEKRVKSMDLTRYRVLAFATHGLMAGEFADYGEPALVLTPPDAGDATDDGLLGASEVAQLKLDADWVILSACNTAAPDGAPGAEGLSGLARAFFYAGSRALLVSHWPVLSDASVRLTTGAIERLAQTPEIGRAEALRHAMLALLDDATLPPEYAHPAIWAPFSLVGEGGAGR
jgi:CHAT domain-containing protein